MIPYTAQDVPAQVQPNTDQGMSPTLQDTVLLLLAIRGAQHLAHQGHSVTACKASSQSQ